MRLRRPTESGYHPSYVGLGPYFVSTGHRRTGHLHKETKDGLKQLSPPSIMYSESQFSAPKVHVLSITKDYWE